MAMIAALFALAVVAAANSGAQASIDAELSGPIDEEITCTGLVPAEVAVSGSAAISVHVLYDGISQYKAKQVMGHAATTLASAGIDLDLSYESWNPGSSDTATIISRIAANHGSKTASGSVDAVHLVTSRDLSATGAGSAAAGQADCIGGILLDHRAFSVSEALSSRSNTFAGRIAGHEIGHLLGGQHHMSDCVEGALFTESSDAGPCTLMFGVASLSGDVVSVFNSPVLLGHAQAA